MLLAGFSFLRGDVLNFNNGDKLSGVLVSETDGVIVFQTDLLGEVRVSSNEATVSTTGEAIEAASVAAVAESVDPPLPTAPEDSSGEDGEDERMFQESLTQARSYVSRLLPEGWEGKINAAFNYTDSDSTSTQLNASLDLSKNSGRHHYDGNLYYNYNATKKSSGEKDTTTDQYGAGFQYRYDVSDRWFLQSQTSYLHNGIKQIRHQVTENVSIGYYVIKEEDFTFSLAPGIAAQYNDVVGESQKWIGFGTFEEDLFYRFNQTFNVEQNAYVRFDPFDSGQTQWGATVALNSNLNEWIVASLVYSFTYDGTVGPGSSKNEQIIAFQLGFPF